MGYSAVYLDIYVENDATGKSNLQTVPGSLVDLFNLMKQGDKELCVVVYVCTHVWPVYISSNFAKVAAYDKQQGEGGGMHTAREALDGGGRKDSMRSARVNSRSSL